MIRTLPPSGNRIFIGDLLKCLPPVGGDPAHELASRISSMLDVGHTFLFSTGRAAMTMLLKCMARRPSKAGKDIVIIPSYTCYSVAASALKAGLKVHACDVSKSTLSYDMEQLRTVDFERVLAIISCNLYGIPDDLQALEDLAREHDVFLIDDAAQCLGGKVGDRPVGSFGDAGILSFDKGKVITTINGGAVVSNNLELATDIKKESKLLDRQKKADRGREIVKLLAYSLLLRPTLYWIPGNMPFLRLGETRYDDTYQVSRYFDTLAPLAVTQLSRLSAMNECRRRLAAMYKSKLEKVANVESITPIAGSEPVYLRYPVRILDPDKRRRFLEKSKKLGCSISYPASIADVAEIRDRITVQNDLCAAGREIASQLVTLPTHAFVREADLARICSELAK